MDGLFFTFEDTTNRVEQAAQKAAFRNFGHAGASIRKDAISTIEHADGPSPPGTPPHTHKGRALARAIRFDADATGAIIGPVESLVGTSGEAHEFGGEYKGEHYDQRAFMGPALDRAIDRTAGDWQGSIGE